MTMNTATSTSALLANEVGYDPIEDRLRLNIRTTIEAVFGPVAELCRSFNRILCAKGERQWERNAQQNLNRKRSGLH